MIRFASGNGAQATQPTGPRGDGQRRYGVMLVNVGTPDAPDAASVSRYLAEFLADPMVIRLPRGARWLQPALSRLIAWRRAPRSAEKYRLIWTERGSPLRTIMEDQAAALTRKLPPEWRVFLSMRYGQPRIERILREIASQGIEDLVVVPLYPHFSGTTTATVVEEVYRVLRASGLHINVTTRTTWYDDVGYVNAQAHLIAHYAAERGLTPQNSFLLFSAHGLPVSYVRGGDPYAQQVTQTVRLVAERLGWPPERMTMAYQSRMGPGEWLGPDIGSVLDELAAAGQRQVLVCPISFVVDCLESLEEIGMRCRAHFEARGGQLHVCPALNTDDRFIAALESLILKGPCPVSRCKRAPRPLIAPREAQPASDSRLGALVTVGVSLRNPVGPGRGPRLNYSEPGGLACAKRPQAQVLELLKELRARDLVSEAFIWNTCQRFECYAWLRPDRPAGDLDCAVAHLQRSLFPQEPEGIQVNVLFGVQAWHHLMRTIAGLNSGLPGDKDIVEQFQSAYQLAERAGTGGDWARSLVREAVELANSVRKQTSWGRFDPGYCYAALARIHDHLPLRLAGCRHVVIGGSATSRSLLHTLREQFGVKESSVTLVYRHHQGGQMKLLRKAVGNGRRLRTHSYSDQAVIDVIADADVVFFGIDADEPVLTADMLRGIRDFGARPLAVVDFNTSGSTSGLESVAGVRVWNADQLEDEVAAFAAEMCARDEFPRVVSETEAWIEGHAPGPVVPSVSFPCLAAGAPDFPVCGQCGRVLEPAEGGRNA